MEISSDVPEVLLARVESAAGPFDIGDRVAVAFTDPEMGRVARCDSGGVERDGPPARVRPIPDAIFIVVETEAGPYAPGDSLALWFVDPRFARIQSTPERRPAARARSENPVRPPAPPATPTAGARTALAAVRLHWSAERVKRFVQVVDRLFTVDRLGWYRHALAMRLLVPDEIQCADLALDESAARHLRDLREAAVATLGQPLLEAFMPSFSVTSDWLDELEVPAGARALAQLRATLESAASEGRAELVPVPERTTTVASIAAEELAAPADASMDALLPVLIPWRSTFPDVTERLSDYRQLLIELFGQSARAARPVRLTQMAEPCHALDDRLWQLVGVVGDAFGGFAPVEGGNGRC